MNNAAALASQTLSHSADCEAAVWAGLVGAAVFAAAIAALEAWLRVPVQPLFDAYLHAALKRVASAAAAFRQASF